MQFSKCPPLVVTLWEAQGVPVVLSRKTANTFPSVAHYTILSDHTSWSLPPVRLIRSSSISSYSTRLRAHYNQISRFSQLYKNSSMTLLIHDKSSSKTHRQPSCFLILKLPPQSPSTNFCTFQDHALSVPDWSLRLRIKNERDHIGSWLLPNRSNFASL